MTWGLLAYLRAADRRSVWGMVVASILFFSAWAFKQSLVWILFSVSLYTLVRPRDWQLLLPLTLPCAAGMAAILVGLGPVYRQNTIAVQTTAAMDLGQGARIFARIFLQNAFCWLYSFVPLVLRRAMRAGREPDEAAGRPGPAGTAALWLALAITFAYGFSALCHAGSNKNHIIEYYIITTTLALAALRRVLDWPARPIEDDRGRRGGRADRRRWRCSRRPSSPAAVLRADPPGRRVGVRQAARAWRGPSMASRSRCSSSTTSSASPGTPPATAIPRSCRT